jgi:hypothetical protein
VRFTYFNSILLPPAAAVRLAQRLRRRPRAAPPRSQLHLTPSSLDPVLELPMRGEAWLIRRGVRLPAGLSLLGVFRNPQTAGEALRESRAGEAPGARLASSMRVPGPVSTSRDARA